MFGKKIVFSSCLITKRLFSTKLNSSLRYLSTMASQSVKQIFENDDIIKSAQDKRIYRGVELTNGMKILLISDPGTDKAAAAMDINIGHMSDPWEFPGLAHFCEHMLFLGTEKYPSENEYQKFLTEHGGGSNAFTSPEHANYYFDITPEELANALDRFAQFFLCPLFTPSAAEREVNAVNSENDKNLQIDMWRIMQLDKALGNPNHDYHKFGTGTKETLGIIPKERGVDIRDELLKFHSRFYSSNVMGLCVLGRESVEELSEMVIPLFSCVQNKNVTVPEWNEHPYGPNELQIKVHVVPVKDVRQLNVTWSIPDLHPYYASNPGHYLGHLIGHEGPGSLLSELKLRGWVNTLVGGSQPGAKGFSFFIVTVDLSEEGLEHTDDIITLIYQYIHMLSREGTQEWVFRECQDLSAMTFRFKEKEKPRGYVSSLSNSLHDFPHREVLSGHHLLTEFRPDLIQMVLDKLVPEKMRTMILSKSFEGKTDLKEKWYGTDHRVERIPDSLLEHWRNCGCHENLRLPERNEFIPTKFDLQPREDVTPVPEVIKDTPLSRLWYKQDDAFLLPKACMSFELRSPYAYIDPTHANMNTLFVSLFKDALNEYAYAAELAGLVYSLDSNMYGIYLSVKGYNDKQHVLLQKILERLTNFTIDPKRFEIIKELYLRSLRNFHAEQPHQHAIYFTSVLMAEVAWTKDELLEALEDVTLERLQSFIPQLLSKMFIEGLIYGNVAKQKALDTLKMVEDVLVEKTGMKPLIPSQHKRFRELQLPDGCYYVYEKTNEVHKGSCIEAYYQCGRQATNLNMLLELFCQVIGEPCFNVLRTQEQLGYIVHSGLRRSNGVQGLRVIIQSDRSPEYVENRVEVFLKSMDEYIKDLTEEEFQKHAKALATLRLEKPKKLSMQHAKFWAEISAQQFHFDRDNEEVTFLRSLSKEDLYKFYTEMIAHDGPKRHKLCVHVVAGCQSQPDGQEIDNTDGLGKEEAVLLPEPVVVKNVAEFKRDLALYPLAKPHIDLSKSRSKL